MRCSWSSSERVVASASHCEHHYVYAHRAAKQTGAAPLWQSKRTRARVAARLACLRQWSAAKDIFF